MSDSERPEPLSAEEIEATLLRLHGPESGSDPEIDSFWVEEAARRAVEFTSGEVTGRPAPDVIRDARDRLS